MDRYRESKKRKTCRETERNSIQGQHGHSGLRGIRKQRRQKDILEIKYKEDRYTHWGRTEQEDVIETEQSLAETQWTDR